MIESHEINKIKIIWVEAPNYAGTQVLNTTPKTRVIRDFFSRPHWSVLIYIVRAFAKRQNFGMNESGFRFEGNKLDWDEFPFEGVELYDPFEEIYLKESDFENLMQKFIQFIIENFLNSNDSNEKKFWWNEFIELEKSIQHNKK